MTSGPLAGGKVIEPDLTLLRRDKTSNWSPTSARASGAHSASEYICYLISLSDLRSTRPAC